MKTKLIISLLAILFSVRAFGQENVRKVDVRLGAGLSLLGSGDMVTFNYENELNIKLNKYFSTSVSLNLGRSNRGVFETASFTQGNLNVFLSPFKNTGRFDFRFGPGFTYYNISDAYISSQVWKNGILVSTNYKFDNRNSYGFNVIIEGSFLITERFLLGVKLFTQPYHNGDINSGGMLKLGVVL
jgi:hypothetical protein